MEHEDVLCDLRCAADGLKGSAVSAPTTRVQRVRDGRSFEAGRLIIRRSVSE
jgi:hypothetical protein